MLHKLPSKYMYTNIFAIIYFLFSLIIFNGMSQVVVHLFNDLLLEFGVVNKVAFNIHLWPKWSQLLLMFIVADFIHWNIHRLLHKVPWLWQFHKVHHSVEEMGFAAHLRYHWMENIVYRTLEYIPLALLGIGLYDFFIIHIFTLAWGHYNHSNISISGYVTGGILGTLIGIIISQSLLDINIVQNANLLTQLSIIGGCLAGGSLLLGGVMKYLFNSPEMHIWHHSYDLPEDRRYGVNFGLTLALWDYLFGTAYIPHNGKDIRLGFPGVETFPDSFASQALHGFGDNEKG